MTIQTSSSPSSSSSSFPSSIDSKDSSSKRRSRTSSNSNNFNNNNTRPKEFLSSTLLDYQNDETTTTYDDDDDEEDPFDKFVFGLDAVNNTITTTTSASAASEATPFLPSSSQNYRCVMDNSSVSSRSLCTEASSLDGTLSDDPIGQQQEQQQQRQQQVPLASNNHSNSLDNIDIDVDVVDETISHTADEDDDDDEEEEEEEDEDAIEFMLPSQNQKELTESPCPTLTESLIAKQMSKLSMTDREKIYFDIHGVSPTIPEDESFIQSKLWDMGKEIDIIPNHDESKKAYTLAYQQNPLFVLNHELRLRFLRADRFDAKLAAQRYLQHYQLKLELFGPDKLGKTIVQEDLEDEGIHALYCGYNQLLPQRDSAGRAVWVYVCNSQQQTYSEKTLMRRFFYNAMMITDDVETQQKGVVAVAYTLGQGKPRSGKGGINTVWKYGTLFRSVPMLVVSFHFCYNKYTWLPMLSILQLSSDLFLRLRFRAHRGSHSDCMYNLQTFGIPANTIPIDENGQVKTEDYRQFLHKRRLQEDLLKANQAAADQAAADAAAAVIQNTTAASILATATATATPSSNIAIADTTSNANIALQTSSQTIIPPSSSSSLLQQQQQLQELQQRQQQLQQLQQQQQYHQHISVPARCDVLLGRGKGYFNHVGNIRYRSLIEDLKDQYDRASKEDKKQITHEVVQIVHQSGGRFLKDDGIGWVLVEGEIARLKVSHSFRAARKAAINNNNNNKNHRNKSSRPITVSSNDDCNNDNNNKSNRQDKKEIIDERGPPVKRMRAA